MEITAAHAAIEVVESSQVSAARFAVTDLARRAGFNEEDQYRAGLVATEMATNLIKHAAAGKGELLLRLVAEGVQGEIELMAIDRGPGIDNLSASLDDGYSTSGTAGTGLGAIQRLSDTFDIHTQPRRGTAILARLRARRSAIRPAGVLEFGAVSVAKAGETVCGDAWSIKPRLDGAAVLVADGLGHGLQAADAASAAVSSFLTTPFTEPSEALQRADNALRHTRGAAAAVADVRVQHRTLRYAGVGNISAAIISPAGTTRGVSHNGTLGHQARYFKDYGYPWPAAALLVLHSDGLASQWAIDAYPGLSRRHPSLIAAVLYRDFSRQRDDVTIVVGREPL
jgi:anti-sigma regulatory factor (Ser/Thr protein kinase)